MNIIRTLDFGTLEIVDRSKICTPYDKCIGYIDSNFEGKDLMYMNSQRWLCCGAGSMKMPPV